MTAIYVHSPTGVVGHASAETRWLAEVATVPDPWNDRNVLHLRRSWPRTGEHVLLEYARAGNPRRVVGQWFAEDDRLHRVSARIWALSGHDGAAACPDQRLVLHGHGVDRRLPALVSLLDDPFATLVVHRPERRAVVRLEADPADGSRVRWVKVVRIDRLAALLARTAHVAPLNITPRLLDARSEDGVTVWEHVPGIALGDMLKAEGASSAMAELGILLHRMHALAAPKAPSLCHGADAEYAVLSDWMKHLRTFDPATHRRVVALRGAVATRLLDASAAIRYVTVHRDLHDGQILVASSAVKLLDPDTVGAGERELDLGNLAAHLRLAACQARAGFEDSDRLFDATLEAYGRDQVDPQRLQAYTAAALLRLVGVHAMRPETRQAVPALIDEVAWMIRPRRS